MDDGSGETVTGQPSVGAPDDAMEFIPPTVPPIGYVPSILAAKALWNWIFYGNPAGSQPVPPTPEEMQQANDLAKMLSDGRAQIVVSGSQMTAP